MIWKVNKNREAEAEKLSMTLVSWITDLHLITVNLWLIFVLALWSSVSRDPSHSISSVGTGLTIISKPNESDHHSRERQL